MDLYPVQKPYFSRDPKQESSWVMFLLSVAFVSAFILVFAWPQTRSVTFILALQQWRSAPLELLFRALTFLGDDQFFMIFFSVLIWCVSKTLGFWGAFMLLASGTYGNLIKDITLLERPPLEGVIHPAGSYAFPSGHTLTAVTVWGYLAVRLQKKALWVWTFLAVVMIGFSRLVLGYHFLGDVLGGLSFGILFLLFFLWVSANIYEKGWSDKLSTPLLLIISIALPVMLTVVLPGADPPKLMGFLAGASFGYLLEKEKVRSLVEAKFTLQVIKVVLGAVVLFGIIFGLGGILPSSVVWLGFIRYALGGIWVTLFAPLLFVSIKLARRAES